MNNLGGSGSYMALTVPFKGIAFNLEIMVGRDYGLTNLSLDI